MSYNYFSPNYFGTLDGFVPTASEEIVDEITITLEYDEIEIFVEVE